LAVPSWRKQREKEKKKKYTPIFCSKELTARRTTNTLSIGGKLND
jgi:hypothetical protein